MERDFDKVYAYAYGWVLFMTKSEYAEYATNLVGATPNASIRVVNGVQQLSFNALTVAPSSCDCETLDEFQDYMLELIRNNPNWTQYRKTDFYTERYVNAWVDAIEYLVKLYPESTPQFKLLSKYAYIIRNSGFTGNLLEVRNG